MSPIPIRTEEERLVDELARPIFNLRMARGQLAATHPPFDGVRRGAETRKRNAENEIRAIVQDYILRIT